LSIHLGKIFGDNLLIRLGKNVACGLEGEKRRILISDGDGESPAHSAAQGTLLACLSTAYLVIDLLALPLSLLLHQLLRPASQDVLAVEPQAHAFLNVQPVDSTGLPLSSSWEWGLLDAVGGGG
jgi:hypothetical protein